MKVWFKRGLFALVALAIFALVGGAIFLLTFNPNSYKQKLADVVYQKYQRTLKIDGELELSLFPRIGLSVQGLSISDRHSDDIFASLESARFAVALWPLMSNRLVVDHVAVTGFKAWIVREEDGSFNFDDLWLAKPSIEQAQAAPSGFSIVSSAQASSLTQAVADTEQVPSDSLADKPKSMPDILARRMEEDTDFQIDIAGLTLRQGEIHFYSRRSNTTARMMDLEVNTGRVTFGQPFDVGVKAQLRGDYPSINAELTGQAQLKLEPSVQSYRAQRLDVRLTGSFDELRAQNMSIKGNLAYNSLLRQFQATQLETSVQGQLLGFYPIQDLQASLSSSRFMIDQAADQLSFEKLMVRANGKTAQQALELAVDAPKMAISPTDASAEPLVATLKITGPRVLGLALNVKGLKGNSEKLYFDDTKLEAALKRGSRVAQLKASSPAEWQPAGQWIKLHDIQSNLRIEDEDNAGSRYNLPITGVADLNIGQSTYSSTLQIQADEARSQLDLLMRPEGELSLLELALQAERLNLDELQSIFALAAPEMDAEPENKPVDTATAADTGVEAGGTAAQAQPAVEEVLVASADPLAWMDRLRLQAKVDIQNLRAHGMRWQDVQAQLQSDDEALYIKNLQANLYEGKLKATAKLAREHQYQFAVNLEQVQLGSLLLDGWGNDYLYGLGNADLQLSTQGSTSDARLADLSGRVRLKIQEGGWRGVDLSQRMHDINDTLRNAFSGDVPALPTQSRLHERTVFKQFQTQVDFRHGQGTFQNLRFDSTGLSVTQGKPASLDLANQQLDLSLLLRLPQKMSAADRKHWQSLRNVAVPVNVSGPLEDLSYRIQWREIKSPLIKKALQDGLLDLLEKQTPAEVLQEAGAGDEQASTSAVLGQLESVLSAKVPADSQSIGQTLKSLLGQ